jgi:excisionase family DNA binding protein
VEEFPSVGTVRQIAEFLRCGRNQAYSLVATGRIRSVRIGKSIRVSRSAVLEFLQEENDREVITPAVIQEISRARGRQEPA